MPTLTLDGLDLAALLCSRVCHDVISPVGAIVNGLVAHGGYRAFGATFAVFSDYCKPAMRLAALMGAGTLTLFLWGCGQKGPLMLPSSAPSTAPAATPAVSAASGALR